MIDKSQALTADEFHYGDCTIVHGKRGGETVHIERWRRNGRTQTWVTRPDEFRVPVKYGLRAYHNITDLDRHAWHTAADCQPQHVDSNGQPVQVHSAFGIAKPAPIITAITADDITD